MGLALFTLTGVGFAVDKGIPLFVSSLIGMITGTFGGALRDVAAMEIPVIFRPGELYAVSSFAGAWVYIGPATSGSRPWSPAVLASSRSSACAWRPTRSACACRIRCGCARSAGRRRGPGAPKPRAG